MLQDEAFSAGPSMYESTILCIFFQVILFVPIYLLEEEFGGLTYEWIGFAQDLSVFKVGISAKRAAWIVRWCSDAPLAGKVQPKALSDVLGRLNFAAAAVDVT